MVGNDIKNEERCSEVVLREGQKKIENIKNICFHLRFWAQTQTLEFSALTSRPTFLTHHNLAKS